MTDYKFQTFTVPDIPIPPNLMVALQDCDGVQFVEEQDIIDAIESGTVEQLIQELREGMKEAEEVGF